MVRGTFWGMNPPGSSFYPLPAGSQWNSQSSGEPS